MKIQTICSILFSRFVTIVFHLFHGGLQHETKPHVTVRLVWISALDSLVGWAPDYIFRGPGAQIRIVVWSIIVSPIPFHFVPWPTPGNDRLITHSRGRFWGDLWWRKSFKEGEMWILGQIAQLVEYLTIESQEAWVQIPVQSMIILTSCTHRTLVWPCLKFIHPMALSTDIRVLHQQGLQLHYSLSVPKSQYFPV